jgi:hypothetical protein
MMKMYQVEPQSSDLHAIGMYRPGTILLDRMAYQPEFVQYWYAFNPGGMGGHGKHVPVFPSARGETQIEIITRATVTVTAKSPRLVAKKR